MTIESSRTKLLGTLTAAGALAVLTVSPAAAATGTGGAGQKLTVTPTKGLNPAGATVTVKGTGYDESKGIYVAICFDQGPGKVPTPCLGGVDTSGASGASKWISSNPPSYGVGLATPFDDGGSFSVTLSVAAVDPVMGYDCRNPSAFPETSGASGCAIVTRADHTRTSDRSSDVRVPVTFTGKSSAGGSAPPSPGAVATSGGKTSGGTTTSGGGSSSGGTVASGTVATPGTSGAPVAGGVATPSVSAGATASGTATAVATPTLASGSVSASGTELAAAPVASTESTAQARLFVGACIAAVVLFLGTSLARRRRAKRD